jgi:phenylalanine-4-hydroxylase
VENSVLTYGEHSITPRGDYGHCAADYTCTQDWSAYTPEQHDRYARLFAARMRNIEAEATTEFVQALANLGDGRAIPRFDVVSARLEQATRWQLVAVPGLIPEPDFFALLATRRFPVTNWLREEREFDYVVEPDVFHDFFGHVPLLFNPVFADYMQAFGAGGVRATQLAHDEPHLCAHALEMLARLYWYTVEFGLIQTPDGMRCYGAGLLSSPAEPAYALRRSTHKDANSSASKPGYLAFDLEQVMRTPYHIDSYQDNYFFIGNFEELFTATAQDFAPIYRRLQAA